MGFLDKFEKGVENVTNRAMSRFSDDIEPIEIASKLRETMDKRAASFARDRSVVPNIFRIHLTPPSIGYSFVGPVEVSFLVNNTPNAPAIEIESSTRRGAAAPAASATATPAHPIVDINGQRYLLTGPVTVIGRGSEADIIVDDSGVSRRHLEIRLTHGNAIASDLGSTNGSFVEGQRVDAVTLVDGNTLTIGRTQILFWDGTQNSGVNG